MGLAISSSTLFDTFERYLKAQKRTNVNQILCYARRYSSILETGDVSELAQAKTPTIRRHGLEALTMLAKFLGCYDIWKDIRLKHQLAWGNASEDNLRYFTNYLSGNSNLDVMLTWLKNAFQRLPQQVGNVLLHNTLTGLRPSENILCIKLIQTDFDNYANEELGVLENFRYSAFIEKKTKKSYLTIYDDLTLQVALNAKIYRSWKAIRSQLKRCGIDAVHTKYCRAIFATWLRKQGIEQEIISLYQGRVPSTVFQASYLKTNIKEDRERILKALHQLKERIEN